MGATIDFIRKPKDMRKPDFPDSTRKHGLPRRQFLQYMAMVSAIPPSPMNRHTAGSTSLPGLRATPSFWAWHPATPNPTAWSFGRGLAPILSGVADRPRTHPGQMGGGPGRGFLKDRPQRGDLGFAATRSFRAPRWMGSIRTVGTITVSTPGRRQARPEAPHLARSRRHARLHASLSLPASIMKSATSTATPTCKRKTSTSSSTWATIFTSTPG